MNFFKPYIVMGLLFFHGQLACAGDSFFSKEKYIERFGRSAFEMACRYPDYPIIVEFLQDNILSSYDDFKFRQLFRVLRSKGNPDVLHFLEAFQRRYITQDELITLLSVFTFQNREKDYYDNRIAIISVKMGNNDLVDRERYFQLSLELQNKFCTILSLVSNFLDRNRQ